MSMPLPQKRCRSFFPAASFRMSFSQTLPEHLHARVEGLRAAVASERLAVEVGHVDVRVLHRRVACADAPSLPAVLAAIYGCGYAFA